MLVFLALDATGATQAIRLGRDRGYAVWVGSDGVTEQEHAQLTQDGANVTRFAYPLANAAPEVLRDAVSTIREHHPDEVIWVQQFHQPL